jgi:predicted nucleic acid-binding protein
MFRFWFLMKCVLWSWANCAAPCCVQGITVSPVDLMIGSIALVHDLTLVTHNTNDFRHIPGLRLDDWLTP